MSLRRYQVGSMEAAYAGLYAVGLVSLFRYLVSWNQKLLGSGKDAHQYDIGSFWLVLCIIITLIQFCRIYLYVHEFDLRLRGKMKKDKAHFISHMKNRYCYRVVERVCRAGAGACVILMVEKKALSALEHASSAAGNEVLHELLLFPTFLLITFGLLLIWDVNFFIWRCVFKAKIDMDQALKESIEDYEPTKKFWQRVSGIGFSLLLIHFLTNPNDKDAPIFFGAGLAIFSLLWLWDYFPRIDKNLSIAQRLKALPRGLMRSVIQLITEIFSPLIALARLFSCSRIKCRTLVNSEGTT